MKNSIFNAVCKTRYLALLVVLIFTCGNVWAEDMTDAITASDLVATNTTYKDFSGVSKNSDAVYAGNSAKDSSGNIQLRSKSSNSGIVSTASGGTLKSVTITVGSGSNTVDVYGKNSAYSSASNLYGNDTQGELIGSTSSTGTITVPAGKSYTHVGIRSSSGALYLSRVEITWDDGSGGSDPTITTSVSSLSEVGYSTTDFSQQVKSFKVSGSNLKADVTVTAPTNYEVCKTAGGTYAASVSFSKGSGTLSDSDVYVRLKSGKTAGNYNGNIECTSTGAAQKDVALTGSVPYTITWSANGSTFATTYVAVGSTLALPASDPDPGTYSCAGKYFYGWYGAGSSYSSESVAPSIAAKGNAVSADKTYYAVFADRSGSGDITWDKVTSAPSDWSGDYVITNAGGSNAMISDFYSGTSGEFLSSSVTISGSQITSTPTDKMIWTIAKNGSNAQYSLKNKSTGTYAKITGTSSTNAALDASAVWFTISCSSGTCIINSVTYDARAFAWYSSRSSFRTYAKTGNTYCNMYKKSGDGYTYSNYATTCQACVAPDRVDISGGFHFYPGETIELTATPTGSPSGSPVTYQWKHNGTNVGTNSSTYTKTNATAADAGSYTCTITYGSDCSATSSGHNVKCMQFYLKNSSGGDISNHPLMKVDATHATLSLNLTGGTTYKFRVTDGCNDWYGNTGEMTSSNCTNWRMDADADCRVTTSSKTATYTFNFDFSDGLLGSEMKVSVVYPSANQAAGKVIYWDNEVNKWDGSKLWYRIGKSTHNTNIQLSKVAGTANFYSVTTNQYDGFDYWHIANNEGNGNGNVFWTKGDAAKAITNAMGFEGAPVTDASVTVTPTTSHSTGGSSDNDNCEFYTYSITSGVKSYTVTSSATNCTVAMEKYNNDVGSSTTALASGGTVMPTQYIKVTVTPNTGYQFADVVVTNGTTVTAAAASTPGVYYIIGNATVTATCSLAPHTVTWYAGGTAAGNITTAGDPSTSVEHGSKVTKLPTNPDGSPCDKTFVGWTNTTTYTHGTSLLFTDAAGSPTINADASFYAVFAEVNSVSASLTKMTADDDLEVGDKIVIIAQDTRYGMYQASASSYVSYWTTTDMDGEPSLSEIEADAKKYLDVATGGVTDTWKLGDATNGYLYNSSSTYLEFSTTNSSDLTLIKWTDDSFTFQAGQYISCRTDITGANANKWRGAGSSCDPEAGNNCSGMAYYYLYKYVPGGTTATGHTINCADCGSSVTPTYTAAPTGGTVSVTKSATPVASGSTVKTCTAVDLTVTITPATHYTLTGFTATGLTTGTATISPAVNTVVPTASAQTFTVTVSAEATGTLNLTPTFTAQTPLTITLNTNGKGTFTTPTEFPIYAGETFTFPTVTPNDDECATFVGWIAGTTFYGDGSTHDAPVTIAANTVSDPQNSDATYTAVFYETETTESDAYVKVTSAPANWANDHYLIVYEGDATHAAVAFDGKRDNGDNGKIDAASNGVEVTITSDAIAKTTRLAAAEWRIAAVTGGYSIQSASGFYIGQTTDANGLQTNSSNAYVNTLAYSSGFSVTSNNAVLRYNYASDQLRFRYYKSSSYTSQQAIQLYKLGTAVVETQTYTTNPACTPKYRVTVASVTGGSPNADPRYNPESTEVSLTANPSAGYAFTSWTITKTTGGDNVTTTLLPGAKATTANTTFSMPAYDVTVTAGYAKIVVSELKVMDGSTVVANTTGSVSGTVNISTGANKTLDVVITPADAFDHSWTASVTAGGTNASISNVTDAGFRVNGLAQGDATVTVTAPNDGNAKVVTFTVHVTDILPEEIILKRDGSDAPIDALTMYYDAANSRGQYVKVNVSFTPTPTNKDFSVSADGTFVTIHAQAHTNPNYYATLNGNKVTTSPVNVTFTSAATSSVTKNLVVTVLPCPADQFVDYIHGNATETRAAQVSADHWSINTSITTPTLSDEPESPSANCEAGHYHLIGWLPQSIAEALFEAGTPITSATEGLVTAGAEIEASGTIWYAIWAKKE